MTAFDDRSPIYRQIAERIEADVLDGTLAPDERIMSTNEFATFYRINPATAAKAFQQLVERGILYKRRGIGMFVSPGARTMLVAERRERFFGEVVEPLVAEAHAIGIPIADVIAHLEGRALEGHALEGHALEGHALEGHALEGHALEGHALEGHAVEGHALEGQADGSDEGLRGADDLAHTHDGEDHA